MSSHHRVTSQDRARRVYKAQVRRTIAETLGFSESEMVRQDRIWAGWCQYQQEEMNKRIQASQMSLRREWESGLEPIFYRQDVKDAFRARVLAIMLAPVLRIAPFEWLTRYPNQSYVVQGHCRSFYTPGLLQAAKLSPSLWQVVARLLEISLDAAGWDESGKKTGKKELPLEGAEERDKAYNNLILQVLSVLPVTDEIKHLFGRYRMRSAKDWSELMEAPIPDHWKVLADEAKRKEIFPGDPAEWDEGVLRIRVAAIKEYAHAVFCLLDHHTFPYGLPLFISQVDWLLTVIETLAPRVKIYPFYRAGGFGDILSHLWQREECKELCHRFARHMLQDEEGKSCPSWRIDKEHIPLAEWLLREFRDTDPELAEKLDLILARSHTWESALEECQKRYESALAPMC